MYKEWRQGYVSEFLSLKCAGDVLNVCSPLGAQAKKEITETMAAVKRIRKTALARPMRHSLWDFCAGNALTSVLSVHLLPVEYAVAVDKRPRRRNWSSVGRFAYLFQDIYNFRIADIPKEAIICAIHSCGELAERVVDIYNDSKASHLVLMPCCNGKISAKIPQPIIEKIGKYYAWAWQLSQKCGGTFLIDDKCISPKNAVIYARKGMSD